MVEHQLPKLAFAGSIPVSRSKYRSAVTISSRLFLLRKSERLWSTFRRRKKASATARGDLHLEAHHTVQVQGIPLVGITVAIPANIKFARWI